MDDNDIFVRAQVPIIYMLTAGREKLDKQSKQ